MNLLKELKELEEDTKKHSNEIKKTKDKEINAWVMTKKA